MENIWGEIMKFGIVLAGLTACVLQGWIFCIRRKKYWAWVELCFSIICLYWAGYYIRSLLDIKIGSTHQLYVRTPIMLTLILIACCGVMTIIRIKKK